MTDTFDKLSNPEYSRYIHLSRYARWIEREKRRETWGETVRRYIDFFKERFPDTISSDDMIKRGKQIDWEELYDSIYNLEVMPSMRCLMTAGKALEKDNIAGYNCAFIAVDDYRVFDEIMYVLMCGTGVGFSVERQFVQKLPIVAEEFFDTESVVVPRDSKIGWATGYRELISLLYSGKIPKWDFSKIRGAGERLKTFGGRASGPKPLGDLFRFTINIFKGAKGRKLTSIECHDLVCKVADIVVVGGVRRSALISLSNLSDERMREAKSGAWREYEIQRELANNSVAYTEKPEIGTFMKEWLSLYQSKSGERGIFNREACNKLLPQRRKELGYTEFGTNPCSEIILRASGQGCNLSTVIVRIQDTLETLTRKIRIATILGTLQSTLTNFRYLRKVWQRNCEEERLLGVSMTGIMDHSILSNNSVKSQYDNDDFLDDYLSNLKKISIETNQEYAKLLEIPESTAITCIKPEGTTSQLTDTASGIHPRYSPYYIRTVRGDKKDPLTQLMIDQGVPGEDQISHPETTYIFSFPMKAPKGAITRDDRTAIEQLELWKIYQLNYCEHKPSITVYVKEHEWLQVGAWVYENFDIISGVSFLPHYDTDHGYEQAPYQEIDEEIYDKLVKEQVKIDWSKLGEYETEDMTVSTKELACSAGECEL